MATGGAGSGYDWYNDPRALPYRADIDAGAAASRVTAAKYGGQAVTPQQLANQIGAESSFDPSAVNSKSGASGIAQILPSTAAQPGYGLSVNASDPSSSIRFAGAYDGAVGISSYSGGGYSMADLEAQNKSAIQNAANSTAEGITISSDKSPVTLADTSVSTGDGSSAGVIGTAIATVGGSNANGHTGIFADIDYYWKHFMVGILGLVFVVGGLMAFRPVQNAVATGAKMAV